MNRHFPLSFLVGHASFSPQPWPNVPARTTLEDHIVALVRWVRQRNA